MKQQRQSSSQFGAPWSRGLKITTWIVIALVLDAPIILPFVVPREQLSITLLCSGAVVLILGIAALFCVRGYTIHHRELWIQRSFWHTRLRLKGLERAYADADALKKCVRTCGNGGFMAFTGWFWSKKLGKFRAFATDPVRCVVLEFAKRKLVVSPDDPAAFVRALGFDPDARRGAD